MRYGSQPWTPSFKPSSYRGDSYLFSRPPTLRPLNFASQFIVDTEDCPTVDEAAYAKVHVAVDEILAGKLSPDTDFLKDWIFRYGDNMIKSHRKDTIVLEGDKLLVQRICKSLKP